MRSSLVVAAALTTLVATAGAKPMPYRPYPPAPSAQQLAGHVVEAIRARDVAALQGLLAASVHHEALWFADPACAKQFGKPGVARNAAVRVLARCLAKQRPIATTRDTATMSAAILTFDPGIEIEVQFSLQRIVWIGPARLTAQAFESLRTAGTMQLDDKLAGKLTGSAFAWIEVCLDRTGAIASKRILGARPDPTSAETLLAATEDWTFRPFAPRRRPTPICAASLVSYPAASAPATEELPATATRTDVAMVELKEFDFDDVTFAVPLNVPPSALERLRVRGTAKIEPDATTKQRMKRAGKTRVTAVLKLCVDRTGRPQSVTLLKSSGFADYDRKLDREMRRWMFRPYPAGGSVMQVCSAMTFIVQP